MSWLWSCSQQSHESDLTEASHCKSHVIRLFSPIKNNHSGIFYCISPCLLGGILHSMALSYHVHKPDLYLLYHWQVKSEYHIKNSSLWHNLVRVIYKATGSHFVSKVDVFEGKWASNLSDFDKGQIVVPKLPCQSISNTAALVGNNLLWSVH